MHKQSDFSMIFSSQKYGGFYKKLYGNKEFDLSKREAEVLVLMSIGLSICEISDILCREKTTVYKHLEKARAKLNCKSLLILGIKLGKVFDTH